jgi:hypothetical protein
MIAALSRIGGKHQGHCEKHNGKDYDKRNNGKLQHEREERETCLPVLKLLTA